MFWTILGTLIPKLFTNISEYITEKQRHKQSIEVAKVEAEIERIKARSKMIADADIASIEAQRYSIKDEIVMICILSPYIGAFIPGLQVYVQQGFQILAGLPEWYQVSIIGVIISVMGLRFMLGKFFKK